MEEIIRRLKVRLAKVTDPHERANLAAAIHHFESSVAAQGGAS
tara:strand:+ start:1340 stop:1468 length:129 start_codon:yes stop_codon:yes gene_type:complete